MAEQNTLVREKPIAQVRSAEDKLPPEQNILVLGGLIGISIVIVQDFLTPGACNTTGNCGLPATISIIAFAVGLPTMAISILFAYAWLRSEKKVVSKSGNVLRLIGYVGLSVGIIAAFWQLRVYAGVLFLVCSFISLIFYIVYTTKVRRDNPRQQPDPKELFKAIRAIEIVNYPKVEDETSFASLAKGLPAQFRIDIPEESDKAMLDYLRMNKEKFAAYISGVVVSASSDFRVVDISYSEGSFLVNVVLGADRWVRVNFADPPYLEHATVGQYPGLKNALDQLNSDLSKAVEAIKDSLKEFFQSDYNP